MNLPHFEKFKSELEDLFKKYYGQKNEGEGEVDITFVLTELNEEDKPMHVSIGGNGCPVCATRNLMNLIVTGQIEHINKVEEILEDLDVNPTKH